MRYVLLILLIVLSLPAKCIEISNFKSGLACTHTRLPEGDEGGWICQPTTEVLVTDQGSCVYNEQEKRCTWIGFEFDYRNAKEGQKLQCLVQTSEPIDSGNPKGIIGKGTATERYEFPLPAGNGHFFNPQYFIFNVRTKAAADGVLDQRTTCSADGKVVFESMFKLIFPIIDEPEA